MYAICLIMISFFIVKIFILIVTTHSGSLRTCQLSSGLSQIYPRDRQVSLINLGLNRPSSWLAYHHIHE